MALVVDLFAGVALEIAFVGLVRAVQKVKDQAGKLKPKLEELEGTLELLGPVIKDIAELNRQLGGAARRETEELAKILEDGEKLVFKCYKYKGWNILRKSNLYEELMELDNKLLKFLRYMQALIARDVKEIKLDLRKMQLALNYLIQLNHMYLAALNNRPPPASNLLPSSSNVQITNLAYVPANHSASDPVYVADSSTKVILHGGHPMAASPHELDCRAGLRVVMGSVFEKFATSFLNVKNNDMVFKFEVQLLQETIESLSSEMKETEEPNIKGQNGANDREKENIIMRLMEDGKKLVKKCREVEEWDFVKRWEYQSKVVEMDNKLLRFHSFQLQAMNQKQLYAFASVAVSI